MVQFCIVHAGSQMYSYEIYDTTMAKKTPAPETRKDYREMTTTYPTDGWKKPNQESKCMIVSQDHWSTNTNSRYYNNTHANMANQPV